MPDALGWVIALPFCRLPVIKLDIAHCAFHGLPLREMVNWMRFAERGKLWCRASAIWLNACVGCLPGSSFGVAACRVLSLLPDMLSLLPAKTTQRQANLT
mmetsp:Transcript_24291/g.32774  ORF Transcript_24291/g.32774 Transcript_24291/m.32774 type:complete len:100 (-) Transcript_24291:25-324(-)